MNAILLHTSCTIEFVAPIVKPLVPSDTILKHLSLLSLKYLIESFISASLPVRNLIANKAERVWLMTVAIAAPLTPSEKRKMRIGSRTIFVTAPIRTEIIPI